MRIPETWIFLPKLTPGVIACPRNSWRTPFGRLVPHFPADEVGLRFECMNRDFSGHLTNAFIFRMISAMRKECRTTISRPVVSFPVGLAVAVLLLGIALTSCASAYKYPVPPPPTTTVLPVGYEDAFKAALSVLKEDGRLVLHVIDKDGRFVAWEKTSGFIFFQHRTILDIMLEPVSAEETKLTMQLSAEDYELGGLTRPAGWYPSSNIDAFLGEDIVGLIKKRIAA